MAEAFIGLSVLVTLRQPPNAKVRGLVTDVTEGQLELNKASWLATGGYSEHSRISGADIVDIEVEEDNPVVKCEDSLKEDGAVDPAIVSYGRGATLDERGAVSGHAERSSPTKADTAQNAYPAPRNFTALQATEIAAPSATLIAPFSDLSLNGQAAGQLPTQHSQKESRVQHEGLLDGEVLAPGSYRSNKRGKRAKQSQRAVSTQTQTLPVIDVSNTPNFAQKRRASKQKGWRQTPLLTDPYTANDSTPGQQNTPIKSNLQVNRGSVKGRRRLRMEEEERNGWATEEATDIQDMGEFDFEQNLSKFDKKKVFDEIRLEDTTADEARLISHNRNGGAKPGTAGGKNLHYAENVLDSPKTRIEHSSDSESVLGSTKMSRSSTRNSARKPPSRKGSAIAPGDRITSGSTLINDAAPHLPRSLSPSRALSPRMSNKTDSSTSRYRKATNKKASFRVANEKKPMCQCISPLQMLELEQLATSEFGLTEDMMTENAACAIAETAYRLAEAKSASSQPSTTTIPLVVILAGNHKTGSRAIAAARHLHAHSARTILCILGPLERPADLLDSVQRQLAIYKAYGGHAIKQDALMRTLRKQQAPTDLIVDALLGVHVAFEDLRVDEQAEYWQLMCWANGSDADVLAVDIPSGVDAGSGVGARLDGQRVDFRASAVICLGKPKRGLLGLVEGMGKEEREVVRLWIADLGIAGCVGRKLGVGGRRVGGEFGGEWVVGMEFVEGVGG